MEVKIPDEVLRQAVAEAILVNIGVEGQKKLIEQALVALLKRPDPTGYNRTQGPSPIEEAFSRAIGVIASQIVMEAVRDPEGDLHKQIAEWTAGAISKILTDEAVSSRVRSKIETAVEDAFLARDRDRY